MSNVLSSLPVTPPLFSPLRSPHKSMSLLLFPVACAALIVTFLLRHFTVVFPVSCTTSKESSCACARLRAGEECVVLLFSPFLFFMFMCANARPNREKGGRMPFYAREGFFLKLPYHSSSSSSSWLLSF